MVMKYLLWIGISAIFVLYALRTTDILSFKYRREEQSAISLFDEDALFSTCVLAEFAKDGWTKEVMRNARVDYDPIKKCDTDFTPFTVLGDNGTVWLNPTKERATDVNCWARALYHQDDRNYIASEFVAIDNTASKAIFNADFVHARCQKADNSSEVVEDVVHLQMWNANDDGGVTIKFPEEDVEKVDEKPSVFIFVFDSVANSQALRSLPKTVSLLEHEFDAVNLRHVNKIGENSHPNGMAMLFGKLINDIDRRVFGMGKEKADWNETHACYRYIDDERFILKEFTKKGYKSLMAEDWAAGVFNHPNCWGFKEAPVTHYMRPFQLYYEEDLEQSNTFMGENQCLEPHTFLFQYLDKFIDAYKESPKISLLWADVAHDNADALFHVDTQLFNYFRKHRDVLDKSYVFLMGDHGIRWGKVRDTWIGEREINNSMMFVSVPRHLRKRIKRTLKENSNKLLTTFDIHASLVDILNEPHLGAKEGPRGLRGNSVFRPLPPGERSCRTLPIPIQFCPCEWNKTKSEDDKVNEEIGHVAVNLLNAKLRELQIIELCKEFTFKKAIDLKMIDRTGGLVEILFAANECDAEFKTIIRTRRIENGSFNATSGDFIRWNSYGDTSCINSRASLRPLCCCRTN